MTTLQTPKEYKFTAGVVFIGKILDKEAFLKFDADVNKKELEGEMSCSSFSCGENFILIEMFDSVYSFSKHIEMNENGSKERKENYENLMKAIGGNDENSSFKAHCFGKLPNDLKKLIKQKYKSWTIYDEASDAMNFVGHLWTPQKSMSPW
eukprot:gene2592-3553_t